MSLLPSLAGADALGWTAAALMVLTFGCRDARTMRPLAVATNLAFIGYGAAAALAPVVALHTLLLPINLWRWAESRGLRRRSPARPPPAAALLVATANNDEVRIESEVDGRSVNLSTVQP